MPMEESQMNQVKTYYRQLKCVDDPAVNMKTIGNYDTYEASLLTMRLVRCDETAYVECKTEEQITEFFRNKFLFLVFNEKILDLGQY